MTFLKFLAEKHSIGYVGTDDAMSDSFDKWVGSIEPDEWIKLAEEWGNQCVKIGYVKASNDALNSIRGFNLGK